MHGSDMDTEAGLLSVKVKTAQRWDREAAERRGASRGRWPVLHGGTDSAASARQGPAL